MNALLQMSIGHFVERVREGITGDLVTGYKERYGSSPSEPERKSWRVSLNALAEVLEQQSKRIGNCQILLEYAFPESRESRADAILVSCVEEHTRVVIVELKQHREAEDDIIDSFIDQALKYESQIFHLTEYFSQRQGDIVESCVFAHSLVSKTCRDPRVFKSGDDEAERLGCFIVDTLSPNGADISKEDALHHAEQLDQTSYVQSSALIDVMGRMADTLSEEGSQLWPDWADAQRKAIEEIWEKCSEGRHVIIIEGPPGSGKSAVALELVAKHCREEISLRRKDPEANATSAFKSYAPNSAYHAVLSCLVNRGIKHVIEEDIRSRLPHQSYPGNFNDLLEDLRSRTLPMPECKTRVEEAWPHLNKSDMEEMASFLYSSNRLLRSFHRIDPLVRGGLNPAANGSSAVTAKLAADGGAYMSSLTSALSQIPSDTDSSVLRLFVNHEGKDVVNFHKRTRRVWQFQRPLLNRLFLVESLPDENAPYDELAWHLWYDAQGDYFPDRFRDYLLELSSREEFPSEWKKSWENAVEVLYHGTSRKPKTGLFVCDEAHAMMHLREGYRQLGAGNNCGRPVPLVPSHAQRAMEEARVAVFLIDAAKPGEPTQGMRRQENTSASEIMHMAEELGISYSKHTLDGCQFRTAEQTSYEKWLESVLGLSSESPSLHLEWKKKYSFTVCDSPFQMEAHLRDKIKASDESLRETPRPRMRARIVAGFAWDWTENNVKSTKAVHAHSLEPVEVANKDILISKPQPSSKYQWPCEDPEKWQKGWNPPDSGNKQRDICRKHWVMWILGERPFGEYPTLEEVGCIYTTRGFEFDYVGVVVGRDLLLNDGRWECGESKDREFKINSTDLRQSEEEVLLRLKSAYRILLTRARKGVYVYFCDDEMRTHFEQHLVVGSDV